MDLLLKARAIREGSSKNGQEQEWDEDCSSVLQKFPPQLRNRIENILSQKQEVSTQEKQKVVQQKKKPQPFSFEDRAVREREAKKKARVPLGTKKKNDQVKETEIPAVTEAVQLTPRSKHEHVTRCEMCLPSHGPHTSHP